MNFNNYKNYWKFSGSTSDALHKVGGDPKFQAEAQLAFLQSVGVKDKSKVLDIGCGCLRGAEKLVGFLNKGGYTGLDISEGLLQSGKARLRDIIEDKDISLVLADSFDYKKAVNGRMFNVVFSNSVVTHLAPEDLHPYFKGIADVLRKTGKAYFTCYPLDEKDTVDFRGNLSCAKFKKSFIIAEALKAGLEVKDIEGDFLNPKPTNKIIERVNTPELGQWVMEAKLCKKQ